MAEFDFILRQCKTASGGKSDFGVTDGKIAGVGSDLPGSSSIEIDLSGKQIYPGFIDAHVHFNEPGRAEWEGISTGSQALAAGGATVFCDMPLNSSPPVLNADELLCKKAIGEEKSSIDFALWGGMVPGNLEEIEGMAKAGAVGLKAFMAYSGLDEFPGVKPEDLREGMARAAEAGILVALHAESQKYIDELAINSVSSIRDFLYSRPIEAETEAIGMACEFAEAVGCPLHIVHCSSAAGIAIVQDAKRRGVDVSVETCPHYLLLNENDLAELGVVAKCAPPLRAPREVEKLRKCVEAGKIDTVGSDHSPTVPEKKNCDFPDAWGGISSCQHALPAFLADFPDQWETISSHPAQRMGLFDRKGSLDLGIDADFAIIDFGKTDEVRSEDLLYRHAISPYVGRTINC